LDDADASDAMLLIRRAIAALILIHAGLLRSSRGLILGIAGLRISSGRRRILLRFGLELRPKGGG
jgi:hypothetical protein